MAKFAWHNKYTEFTEVLEKWECLNISIYSGKRKAC